MEDNVKSPTFGNANQGKNKDFSMGIKELVKSERDLTNLIMPGSGVQVSP